MYISISSNWSKTNTRQTKTRPENYSPRHNFYLHICQLCQNARIILEIKKHFVFKISQFFNTIDTDFCALPIQTYWLQQKFKLNWIMLICQENRLIILRNVANSFYWIIFQIFALQSESAGWGRLEAGFSWTKSGIKSTGICD